METSILFEKNQEGNFLYIRHGQTHFNKYSDQHGEDEAAIKKEFLDCHLSEIGEKQAESLQDKLKDLSIKYVFCSPLHRCLMTCLLSLKNHPQRENFKVIIHPLITETVHCVHDFSQKISEKKDFFSLEKSGVNFDWSYFESIYKTELDQELYYMEFMDNLPESAKPLLEKIKDEDLIRNKQYEILEKYLLEFSKLTKSMHQRPESLKRMFDRHLEFKEYLKTVDVENTQEKILIYTHSNFIMVGTSQEIFNMETVQDFPVDCYKPDNCEIISMLI